jgi:AraC family transcriptional activator of pobA
MANKQIQKIKTISEYHRLRGLPKPEHPLISLIDYGAMDHGFGDNPVSYVFDFYSISLKRSLGTKMKYGQQSYDFDAGVMFFIAPGQVFSVEVDKENASNQDGFF